VNDFSYVLAKDVDSAIRAAQDRDTKFLGAGTNLLDLMKGGVERPLRLVDLTRLPLAEIAETEGGGLRIGALARNSDVAAHPAVRTRYPLLSQALLAGASQQLRNMATVGGNLLQRTRCPYFYDTGFAACNKRAPGSGCGALEGHNRGHAILGVSGAASGASSVERCIAVNPSDMSVALAALDATVRVRGAKGERAIPIADFHRLPGETPERDTNLAHGELIIAVDLPSSASSGFSKNSFYLKVRDRASYAFALVSVAAALDLQGGSVRAARIVLGGVAHKPWRATDAEKLLIGKPLEASTLNSAAEAAVANAKPYRDNAFKVVLAKRAVARAVREAAGIA
jgi:xanthine dehydrogenase YagS FAD-binding subunit